jgi:hypothetical protein
VIVVKIVNGLSSHPICYKVKIMFEITLKVTEPQKTLFKIFTKLKNLNKTRRKMFENKKEH